MSGYVAKFDYASADARVRAHTSTGIAVAIAFALLAFSNSRTPCTLQFALDVSRTLYRSDSFPPHLIRSGSDGQNGVLFEDSRPRRAALASVRGAPTFAT